MIVDPTRPDVPGYRWLTQVGPGPYGGTAYAGGGLTDRPAAGGLTVQTDSTLGQVRIDAWWAGAPYLRIMRLIGDDRSPVRGAYPRAVTVATRRNLCTNPSFEVDTVGHLAAANTTLTRVVGPTLEGAAFGRLKATAAGPVGDTLPVLLPTDSTFYVSLALYLSAAPTGALTVTATWQDQNGAALTPSTATISAGTLAAYVGRWDRIPNVALTPPNPVVETGNASALGPVQGALSVSIAGMAAAATADVDAILVSTVDGPYFDGTDTYAQWTGTPHASVSALAGSVSIIDAEAPLDVPIAYELTAPDQPAFRVVSEQVVLDSGDRTWLGHPTVGLPMLVNVAADPEQTYTIARGLFAVLGRPRPVAVTGNIRQAPSGTHEIWVETHARREQLLEMLDDGLPLLLRAPARLGHGPGEWISVGDVTVTPPGHGAWDQPATFKMPYQVVDAPASDLAA